MRTIRRRRLKARTDYKARLELLKSEMPRLVVRKTNKYLVAQIVETEIAQDKVIISLTSKILIARGCPKELEGSLKSLPASYLTGFIIGKLAQEKGIKKAILDSGMHRNVKNSRIYALVKGAIDSGLEIPVNEEVLPKIETIKTEKFAQIFDKIVGGDK